MEDIKMKPKSGDKVKIEYTGTFENGEVFDSSKNHGKPLEFELGSGMVIKGFEDTVLKLELGEESDVTIKPEEGYGHINPELIKEVPKKDIGGDEKIEIKPGMMLAVGLPNGQQIPATVKEVKDEALIVDLNHPLAGKVLKFKIKLVGINEPSEEKDEPHSCENGDCSDCKE